MPVEKIDLTIKWIRRIARTSSVLILGVALVMLIGHLVAPEPTEADYPPIENLLPVIMFLSVLGLGIAWRWEGLGGAISVGFFVVHLALYWTIRQRFFPLGALAVLSPILITGILFLVCWVVRKLPWLNPDLCGGLALCRSRMREEDKVVRKLSANDIQNLGFDWPKYALIEEYCVIEDGKVDLTRTIEKMQSSRAYYKRQLDEAFAFKMRTGADYSDFTDRFDDNARMNRELGQAISYLEEIIEAAEE